MAPDDDPVDELRSVGMTGAAAMSRVAETLIRASQDAKLRAAQAARQQTEDAQRRYEAQAKTAEQFYQQTTQPQWMNKATGDEIGQAWKGAHQWREIDPERFGPYADQLNQSFLDSYAVNLRDLAEKTGSLDTTEDLARKTVGLIRGDSDRERTQQDRDLGEQAVAEADGRAGAAGASAGRAAEPGFPIEYLAGDIPGADGVPTVFAADPGFSVAISDRVGGPRRPISKSEALDMIDHTPADWAAREIDFGGDVGKRKVGGLSPLDDFKSWKGADPDVDRAIGEKFPQLLTKEERAARDRAPVGAEHEQAASEADGRARAAGASGERHGQVAEDLTAEADTYDTPERRQLTTEQMKEGGVPEGQREAKMTADHLNGQDPRSAARSGQTRQKAAAKGRGAAQGQKRTTTIGRSR